MILHYMVDSYRSTRSGATVMTNGKVLLHSAICSTARSD
jgi:hypothetical protein